MLQRHRAADSRPGAGGYSTRHPGPTYAAEQVGFYVRRLAGDESKETRQTSLWILVPSGSKVHFFRDRRATWFSSQPIDHPNATPSSCLVIHMSLSLSPLTVISTGYLLRWPPSMWMPTQRRKLLKTLETARVFFKFCASGQHLRAVFFSYCFGFRSHPSLLSRPLWSACKGSCP